MKLIFAGTPGFAAIALDALYRAGHEIALVLTQPDRPSGRGLRALPSPVKRLAEELHLDVTQPASLKQRDVAATIEEVAAEAMIVAAYGLIIPPNLLPVPRRGCINIHASLLPRWRGAAPIQRALLAGDMETGISIMQMDAGLDTGPVLLQEAIEIQADDTAQRLHDRLATLGARLVVRALERQHTPLAQDDSKASYAAKIAKSEARIDWSEPASVIERKVRAFDPFPGAATVCGDDLLKIWAARPARDVAAAPGTVARVENDGITVACGGGEAITLLEVQRAGGKRLPVSSFLAGKPIRVGERLGA
jgi:methionyl-tRNA formyltransferase